jgi:hypothetical protein
VSGVASTIGRHDPPHHAPRRAAVVLSGCAIVAGLIAGQLVATGHPVAVVALALIALPVVLWKRLDFAPAFLLAAALLVEQFGYAVGPRAGAYTAKLPLFHGLAGGLHISPADLLLCMLLAFCVAKSGSRAVAAWPRSPLATAMLTLFGFVLVGIVVGKMHGGQTRVALTEVRPYAYLLITFILASLLLVRRSSLRLVFWGIVVVVAIKAIQGLLIFKSVRHLAVRPDAVLGHEEALFFALFFLFTLALWLFEVEGTLRKTATWLVPVVLAGDLANTRRAAWLVLGVGLIALLAVTYATLPSRRKMVGRIAGALALFLAMYLPLYWNKSGGLAQPARAIHSAVKPNARDASSDLYRIQEDQNLWFNIREGKPLGRGFGVPIDYALPIDDISDIDPLIAYVPHNGVLYIVMRMGVLGGIAFWSLIGCAIVLACRLARDADRELAAVGATVAAILVSYMFEGQTDQGFFFYRVAFVMGTLLGVLEAARRLSAARAAKAAGAP